MPGRTMTSTGPAKTVDARACASERAESTRCTIAWSRHQYHSPPTFCPMTMPTKGKSGSSIGL
eukprot:scaffold48777_cov63-Phaeocystis_antarctica.AAC.2